MKLFILTLQEVQVRIDNSRGIGGIEASTPQRIAIHRVAHMDSHLCAKAAIFDQYSRQTHDNPLLEWDRRAEEEYWFIHMYIKLHLYI